RARRSASRFRKRPPPCSPARPQGASWRKRRSWASPSVPRRTCAPCWAPEPHGDPPPPPFDRTRGTSPPPFLLFSPSPPLASETAPERRNNGTTEQRSNKKAPRFRGG